LTQHAISRLPARARTKDFDYDTKEIFDKPDGAKLKNKKPLELRDSPFTVHYGRIPYGQIPQFLGGNMTAGCKTLSSGVLVESQFCSEFGTRIAF
jgi:hypothetical protein